MLVHDRVIIDSTGFFLFFFFCKAVYCSTAFSGTKCRSRTKSCTVFFSCFHLDQCDAEKTRRLRECGNVFHVLCWLVTAPGSRFVIHEGSWVKRPFLWCTFFFSLLPLSPSLIICASPRSTVKQISCFSCGEHPAINPPWWHHQLIDIFVS